MFTMIFAELITGFKRIWKLYLTNILALMLIILLFAYIDGSRRQLNMQNTIFSGEIVVKLNQPVEDLENILFANIESLERLETKIRSNVSYKITGQINSENAQLIGVNLDKDENLRKFLNLQKGAMPRNVNDILVPSSLSKVVDIDVGTVLNVMGKTADKLYNMASFRICGVYNAPGLDLFQQREFLVSYDDMRQFFMPGVNDVEYCLFFRDGRIPKDINLLLRNSLKDADKTIIDKIESRYVSDMDVLNISVQFNTFLILIIVLTLLMIITVIVLVNFNVYMVLFRKKQTQIGTLMAFGVGSTKIGLMLFLESIFQVTISLIVAVAACILVSVLSKQHVAVGFIEILLVLLSGTNVIDFYIKAERVALAFALMMGAVTLAQIPILIKMLFLKPVSVMRSNI